MYFFDRVLKEMPSLLIVTNAYPFPPGEQFFADEVKYWADSSFESIYISPEHPAGKARSLPPTLKLLASRKPRPKILFAIRAIVSKLYWSELYSLFRTGRLSMLTIKSSLSVVARTYREIARLQSVLKMIKDKPVVYTYWNDVAFYAACLLKSKGAVAAVVSRTHGFDIYENRYPGSYAPLKRSLSPVADQIFSLTESAKSYYNQKYGFPVDSISLAPLGVPLLKSSVEKYSGSTVIIVSISSCIRLKRIDKIIQAVAIFAQLNPGKKVKWIHVGDGILRKKLTSQASSVARAVPNFDFQFCGQMENHEVRSLLEQRYIDLIVNASETEGVPVALMEAMSFGIPAIAPNVGGISTLVTEDSGYLLGENPTSEEIAHAIEQYFNDPLRAFKRVKAREMIVGFFSAEKNYKEFVRAIEDIGCFDVN